METKRGAKRRLKVDETKRAVASVFGRQFLGFSFRVGPVGGEVTCKVVEKALATFKQRVRRLTRRSGGCSMEQVVERLRVYLRGWKGDFFWTGPAGNPGDPDPPLSVPLPGTLLLMGVALFGFRVRRVR